MVGLGPRWFGFLGGINKRLNVGGQKRIGFVNNCKRCRPSSSRKYPWKFLDIYRWKACSPDSVNSTSAQKIAKSAPGGSWTFIQLNLHMFLITSWAAWGQDLTATAEFTEYVDQHWRNFSNWRSLGRITTAWKRPVTNAKAAAHTTQTID